MAPDEILTLAPRIRYLSNTPVSHRYTVRMIDSQVCTGIYCPTNSIIVHIPKKDTSYTTLFNLSMVI